MSPFMMRFVMFVLMLKMFHFIANKTLKGVTIQTKAVHEDGNRTVCITTDNGFIFSLFKFHLLIFSSTDKQRSERLN